MLLLRISFLIFFASFLFAQTKILATKAIDKKNKIILFNPIIFYKDAIIQAKEGVVLNKRKIILKDKVFIYRKNQSVISADSLIAYSSKDITLKDVFFYDFNIQGWLIANYAHSLNNIIHFKKNYFSTCCVKNPDWYMKASKADYNKKDKSLRLYNLILVINKIPVFYLPYLYLNFDKTRRSGFLRPYVGYSNSEGVLYSQPIYFVTSINTDLEITPTIRNLRGRGVYATFRFVDSPHSNGYIKGGYFKDYKKYYEKNNLAHQQHYGYTIFYERSSLIFNPDSLYVNLKYANDVDYFYLDAYNYKFNTAYLLDKIITSNINYIYPTSTMLYGVYFKYFIDTSKINNDDTWQILPQLNLHRFLSNTKGFLTSYDLNVYNYYRKKDSNYLVGDILLPVSYYWSFFDDYLKVKVTELFDGGYGFYYQEDSNRSRYMSLSTQIKFYDSLVRKKGKSIHIINPSLTFNLKNYTKSEIYSDLISVSNLQDYVNLNLFQIFENETFSLTHTLNETYYLKLKRYSDLENILNIKIGNFSLSENNKFSLEKSDVVYNNFKISYSNNPFSVSLNHIYKKDSSRTIVTDLGYNINSFKKLYFSHSYDMENKYVKYWLVGVKLNKKCWKYNISFKESRIPVLKNDGISYKKDDIISLSIELIPLGGVNQTFIFKGKE